MKLQKLLSYVRRAADDYNMIENGDRIAVGISGGKDSLSLLIALKELQRFYPKKFEIEAVSVSLGFEGMDFSPIVELCDKINVKYTVINTDIGEIIFNARKEKNPCSLCAKMRKGALNDIVENIGCNKVALGHNRDDVIQTFFMSLFYEGRIYTFNPITFLDRKKYTQYARLCMSLNQILNLFAKNLNLPIIQNKCPADGYTKREDIKNFISEQKLKYDHFDEKIFGAIKRSGIGNWKE